MASSKSTLKASLWTLSGKLSTRLLDFILLLIFSRILTPEDFGLVALAIAPIYVGDALLSLPLTQSLLRFKNPDKHLYDTAFTLSVLRSLALAALFLGLSVPLAHFYGDPRLTPLVCALAAHPVFRGLISPNMVVFMKNMDFRREFALDIVGKTAGFTVAVVIALKTQSYWAIAATTITTSVVMYILSYILAPYRPRFTLSGWSEFANMVGWNSLAMALNATNLHIGRILLGRFVPTDTVGQFSISEDTLSIPVKSVVLPMSRPLMASYAIALDGGYIDKSYNMTQSALVSLMAPVFVAISVLAAPVVFVVFGAKWIMAAPFLKWLAVSWLFGLVYATINPLAMSLDRTRFHAQLMGVEFLIKIPAMIFGVIHFGVWGIIGAIIISMAIAAFYSLFCVKALVGLSVMHQVRTLVRPALAAVVMAGAMIMTQPTMSSALDDNKIHLVVAGIICGVIGLAAYFSVLFVLWIALGRPDGIEQKIINLASARFRKQPSSRAG